MRPPERWPLHPAPAETESLSSWLRRIAASYRMYSHELLEHGLGQRELRDAELDLDPPVHLLEELAKRSGLDQHRVSAMTVAGWVPWLFDTLTPAPDTYETYVHQFSLLLSPGRRNIYAPRKWLPWLSETAAKRGCRECLEFGSTLLLFWQVPVMASCTVHRRRLETYPRYPVNAGVWFRLLRTLLDELSTAQGRYGRQLDDVRRVWEHCGHPFRAGLHSWQPFETLNWTVQQQLLEAAAAAMELIEDGSLTARGTSEHLLRPEPDPPIIDGTPPGSLIGADGVQKRPTLDELWNQATATLDSCIEAAKTDPVVAKHLFDFARYGCRSEESLRGLRDTFAEL